MDSDLRLKTHILTSHIDVDEMQDGNENPIGISMRFSDDRLSRSETIEVKVQNLKRLKSVLQASIHASTPVLLAHDTFQVFVTRIISEDHLEYHFQVMKEGKSMRDLEIDQTQARHLKNLLIRLGL